MNLVCVNTVQLITSQVKVHKHFPFSVKSILSLSHVFPRQTVISFSFRLFCRTCVTQVKLDFYFSQKVHLKYVPEKTLANICFQWQFSYRGFWVFFRRRSNIFSCFESRDGVSYLVSFYPWEKCRFHRGKMVSVQAKIHRKTVKTPAAKPNHSLILQPVCRRLSLGGSGQFQPCMKIFEQNHS